MSTTNESNPASASAPAGGEPAKARGGLVVTLVKAGPGGGLETTRARLAAGLLIISEGPPLDAELLARVIADHQAEAEEGA